MRTTHLEHRRRHQRGSALVLAILILFAMLGLGMLAMRSATQNIAGSGNLRLNKQARYVAEVGLYHAVTLMQQQGQTVLQARDDNEVIEIDSSGAVQTVDGEEKDAVAAVAGAPPVLEAGPPSLGAFQSALVPSYRVTVDGFVPANGGVVGEEVGEDGAPRSVFCRAEFTSEGFVASEALPVNLDEIDPEARFATSSLKATVVIGPFNPGTTCRRSF